MAIIANYIQQPSDTLDYDIPYELVEGDTLASSVAVATPAGLDVDSPLMIIENRVKLWVSGGVAGTKYKVEITTTTALGRVKQDEIYFIIKEF